MNVYMVSSSYEGCSYVRLQLPAFHNGFELSKPSLLAPMKHPATVANEVRNADVVVFHRPENKTFHNLVDILKKDGKKIVMDNDDTFKLSSHPLAAFTPEAQEVELKKRDNSIIEFIKKSDLITASTETLANEYRKYHDNVVVLPNCVDPLDWDRPLRNKTKKIRIGLVGSAAFEYDYLHIRDVIRELDKREDVQMIMFGLGSKEHRKLNPKVTDAFKDDYAFWDTINIEHFPWTPMANYMSTLNEMRLDMMLIPRQDSYFNRCKSNVKFLEAGMCEIPVIAQSFDNGPYEEIENYITGIKIRDNKNWMAEINKLIDDKDLRRGIGKMARKYVLKNYNIETKAHLWADAYSKLYEKGNS